MRNHTKGCFYCGTVVNPAKKYGGGIALNIVTGEVRWLCKNDYSLTKTGLASDGQSVHPSFDDWTIAKWDEE